MSGRHDYTAMCFDKTTQRYRLVRNDQVALCKRMQEIALVRVRYGYWCIHRLLRRESWAINHKRVQRLYHEEGSNLRSKRPRWHVTAARRLERQQPSAAD